MRVSLYKVELHAAWGCAVACVASTWSCLGVEHACPGAAQLQRAVRVHGQPYLLPVSEALCLEDVRTCLSKARKP